ncbi:MAG: glycosyltransferase [Nitrososphaeria archaeon]
MPRYISEIYSRIKANNSVNIDKFEAKVLPLTGKLPHINDAYFYLQTTFKNFARYDIIHNPDPSNIINQSHMKGAISIATIHDLLPILHPELIYGSIKKQDDNYITFYYMLNRLVLKADIKLARIGILTALNSDYIIVNSSQTKTDVIKYGIDTNKVFITNMGVDERFLSKIALQEKRHTFTIGYVGGINYKKNIEFALKASMHIQDSNIKFSIWGERTIYAALIAKKYRKDKKIEFKGFAPEKKLVDVYDSFDVFVFPSFHEGFGQPILEAQSRGLPVIIYKYGKIPKEVRKYCFEAESPEHMAQIIENLKENGYNERLKKKATEYARSFTWEKCAKETLEVYKKLN